MTDEELSISDATLIARLREIGKFSFGWTADQAADRIEALVKQLAEADALIEAQAKDHASNNIRLAETAYRAERLEAALRELVTCVEDGCFCSEMKMATAIDEARAALEPERKLNDNSN